MSRVSAGDSAALGALYDRHGGVVYGLAFAMLRDAGLAADVAQESFLSMWRNAASFDPMRGSTRTWLLTVVRNRCIGVLRGAKPEYELDATVLESAWNSDTDEVWDRVVRDIDAADVRRALDQLPPEQRTTIHLAYFVGLTHAQIAAQMGTPLGTVKGRMRLALEKLKALLAATSGILPDIQGGA